MKILNIRIRNCMECPYMDWDLESDMICDCKGGYRTIIDYHDYRNQCEYHDGPILGKDYVPDWCPLEDK